MIFELHYFIILIGLKYQFMITHVIYRQVKLENQVRNACEPDGLTIRNNRWQENRIDYSSLWYNTEASSYFSR